MKFIEILAKLRKRFKISVSFVWLKRPFCLTYVNRQTRAPEALNDGIYITNNIILNAHHVNGMTLYNVAVCMYGY